MRLSALKATDICKCSKPYEVANTPPEFSAGNTRMINHHITCGKWIVPRKQEAYEGHPHPKLSESPLHTRTPLAFGAPADENTRQLAIDDHALPTIRIGCCGTAATCSTIQQAAVLAAQQQFVQHRLPGVPGGQPPELTTTTELTTMATCSTCTGLPHTSALTSKSPNTLQSLHTMPHACNAHACQHTCPCPSVYRTDDTSEAGVCQPGPTLHNCILAADGTAYSIIVQTWQPDATPNQKRQKPCMALPHQDPKNTCLAYAQVGSRQQLESTGELAMVHLTTHGP